MADLRNNDLYKNMSLVQAVGIIEEFENKILGEVEYLTAWQYIADNHHWKHLQGWYCRQMSALIVEGYIDLPEGLNE